MIRCDMQQQQEVMSSVRFTDAHYGSNTERKGGGLGGGGGARTTPFRVNRLPKSRGILWRLIICLKLSFSHGKVFNVNCLHWIKMFKPKAKQVTCLPPGKGKGNASEAHALLLVRLHLIKPFLTLSHTTCTDRNTNSQLFASQRQLTFLLVSLVVPHLLEQQVQHMQIWAEQKLLLHSSLVKAAAETSRQAARQTATSVHVMWL